MTPAAGQILAQSFALLESGRVAEAKQLARRLDGHRPEPPGLAYLLGLLALADGQGRKAAQHLARAVAQDREALPPALAWARAQVQQARLPEAAAGYRRALALAPDISVGWNELASLPLAAGDLHGALAPLTRAMLLAPERAETRNNLALAQRAAARLADAEGNLHHALAQDPGFAKPYANLAGLRRHTRRPAAMLARRAAQLQPAVVAHQIESAQAELADGTAPAALLPLRTALALTPAQTETLWLLAQAEEGGGRTTIAAKFYRRTLALDPDDLFGAALALATLGQAPAPATAAAKHIATLYDQYASSFDHDLRNSLDYRGPEILLDAIERAGLARPGAVLDLGCGTGLMGAAIKPWAIRLDGVDLSPRMVAQARNRGIYDRLTVADLLHWLRHHADRYDLVVAADVLIHLGDLAPVMADVAMVLRPGGGFAFTVERSDAQEIDVLPSGRFAHSEPYLRRLASQRGLAVRVLEQVSTRRDRGAAVPGLLCVLVKP